MKEKGWKEGTGLGKSSTGIAEPLEADGQTPYCKAGLGYTTNNTVISVYSFN